MYKFVVLSLIVAVAAAVPTPDMRLDCLRSEDLVSCFAVKASAAISRAARSAEIELIDGVSFIRETPVERSGKSMPKSEKQLMAELPADSTERALKVSNMIYDSAVNFFKSHSLSIVPGKAVARSIDEGRAKGIKKYIPMIASLVGVKLFALVPILLGGLSLLVLKALVIGKVALLIAAILAFQKFMHPVNSAPALFRDNNVAQGAWSEPAAPTYAAPANNQPQGYYRRSYEQDAHKLAYGAHAPATDEAL